MTDVNNELSNSIKPIIEADDKLYTPSAIGIRELCAAYPQIVDGQTMYLISGGLAVEFVTGKVREHTDIDIECHNYAYSPVKALANGVDRNLDIGSIFRINIKFVQFIIDHPYRIDVEFSDGLIPIQIVHPAILLLDKYKQRHYGNGSRLDPRKKDFDDRTSLLEHYRSLDFNQKTYWVATLKDFIALIINTTAAREGTSSRDFNDLLSSSVRLLEELNNPNTDSS